jgi:hypothetical protein
MPEKPHYAKEPQYGYVGVQKPVTHSPFFMSVYYTLPSHSPFLLSYFSFLNVKHLLSPIRVLLNQLDMAEDSDTMLNQSYWHSSSAGSEGLQRHAHAQPAHPGGQSPHPL